MDGQDHQKSTGRGSGLRPPWKKGQSGNPGGRPKDKSIVAELRRIIEGRTLNGKKLPKGETVLRKASEAIVIALIGGDMAAARIILDRLEGPVPQAPPPQASDGLGDLNANVPDGLAEAQRRLAADFALKQLGLEGSAPDDLD